MGSLRRTPRFYQCMFEKNDKYEQCLVRMGGKENKIIESEPEIPEQKEEKEEKPCENCNITITPDVKKKPEVKKLLSKNQIAFSPLFLIFPLVFLACICIFVFFLMNRLKRTEDRKDYINRTKNPEHYAPQQIPQTSNYSSNTLQESQLPELNDISHLSALDGTIDKKSVSTNVRETFPGVYKENSDEWDQTMTKQVTQENPSAKEGVFHPWPIKGDSLSMAQYAKDASCKIPIRSLGNGNYLFGAKKVHEKVQYGNHVIRVGGGYMPTAEFIERYGEDELRKLLMLREKGIDPHKDILQDLAELQ